MGEIIIQRRGFILGAALSLFAAPAIVKASNLMAIKPFEVLAATGFERPLDLSTEEYLAQYRSFQKGFLADYRKDSDPKKAKAFPVAEFGSKWSGDHIRRENPSGRAVADDGPFWNVDATKRRLIERPNFPFGA